MTMLWMRAAALLATAFALGGCMEIEESKPKPRLEPSGTAGTDFGATLLQTRRQLDFELSNSGSGFAKVQTLTDISITLSGASPGVSLSHQCPEQLEESESCFISVVYAPTATGALTGQLRVASNAEDSPLILGLTGSAVRVLDPESGALVFSVNPGGAFGPVSRGNSKTVRYTVKNIGNADDAISLSGPNEPPWSVGHDCPATLLVGATCDINVTFSPTSNGVSVPIPLVVTDAYNRDYGALRVSLSGTGE